MLATTRVEKVKERQEFSNYIIPPNKFKFEKLVRVLSIVKKFLQKCSKGKLFRTTNTKFQMFPVMKMMQSMKYPIQNRPDVMLDKNLYSVGVSQEARDPIQRGVFCGD